MDAVAVADVGFVDDASTVRADATVAAPHPSSPVHPCPPDRRRGSGATKTAASLLHVLNPRRVASPCK